MDGVIKCVGLAAILLVTNVSYAGSTAELVVRGVITPQACVPSLDGNGIVAFGDIPAHSLKAGQYTRLPDKQINLRIACANAIKVAIRFSDNRNASTVSGIGIAVSGSGFAEIYNFGLGSVEGKNVGGYLLSIGSGSTADGKPAKNISSSDGTSWRIGERLVRSNGADYVSFGDEENRPTPVKQIALTIDVKAILNKPENLSLTHDVPLDGSATIEVIYL